MNRTARLSVAATLSLLGLLASACGGKHNAPATPSARAVSTGTINVASPEFSAGGAIPVASTCHGAGTTPSISWSGAPASTKTLALVVTDPDAPGGTYVHWLVYNLAPSTTQIENGELPAGARVAENSAEKSDWTPPCPPRGTHHYRFTVYALDGPISVTNTTAVLHAINMHAIASGTLIGVVSAS